MSFQFVTAMNVEQNLPPFRKVDDLVETSKCHASPIPEKYEKLKIAGASLFLTCSVSGGNLVRPKEKLFVYFPDLAQYFPVLLKFSDINYIEIDYTKAPKASQ